MEDNSDELLIYTTLLLHRGYDVLTAEDFDGALETAVEQRPDLAIVDVNLGDDHRDGCDLVRGFREHDRTRDMPVIAHTAFGDVYHRPLARLGCEAIIHKPAEPRVLLDTVTRLIGPAAPPQEPQATPEDPKPWA